jgi:MFS family permease
MQRTAVSWVVYTLTHSSFMLGLSVFCTQFPNFLLSTVGGVVSDRYHRFRVLLATQIASGIQSLLLAILIFTGYYNVWVILGLGAVLGVINAFDVPARQAMVFDMVADKEDLPNALALNSSMFNLARLIGPAIAGFVLHNLGDAVCFALNAASFIAVIVSLLRMKLPPYEQKENKKNAFAELRDGWQYLRNTPAIARVILMLAAMSLLVIPYWTLLPIYAKQIYHGNAATFGVIDSFTGLGAIFASLYLATRATSTDASRKKILRTNTIIFGIGLIGFAYTPWFSLAMVFAVITGYGMQSQTTMTNTIIQTTVAPEFRGRVISYFAMSYVGMMPLGSLLVGTVSQFAGAPNTVFAEGLVALVVVAIYWKFLTASTANPARPVRTAPAAAPPAHQAAGPHPTAPASS